MKKLFAPGEVVLWAGSQASFDLLQEAIALASRMQASSGADGPRELPSIWSKADGVATVNIEGSLIDGEAGWMRIFGVLGYDDINNALVDAATDPEVKQILMHINSGGGQVNGVMDLSNTIKQIGKVKPIDTHSTNMMASAAYWLGVNGRHISADQTTVVGSIGVLTVHAEMSKQLAQDGINVTVMRSGEFKALSNKYEPLTDAAKAEIQGRLDDIYGMFIAHVADARGLSVAAADKQMGQGKEFLGKRALAAGLIDKVSNYDKVISFVKKIDNTKLKHDNPSNSKGNAMKKTLTEAQLAMIAAGVPEAQVRAAAGELPEEKTELTEAEKTAADAKAAADAAATLALNEAIAKAAADKVLADAGKTPDPLILHLTAQLTAANEALVTAKVEVATLKASTAQQDGLLKIARGAVGKMHVALGGSADAFASLDAAAVVAEHTRVEAVFLEKFKPGGAAQTTKPEKPAEAQVDPRFEAAVKRAPSFTAKQ